MSRYTAIRKARDQNLNESRPSLEASASLDPPPPRFSTSQIEHASHTPARVDQVQIARQSTVQTAPGPHSPPPPRQTARPTLSSPNSRGGSGSRVSRDNIIPRQGHGSDLATSRKPKADLESSREPRTSGVNQSSRDRHQQTPYRHIVPVQPNLGHQGNSWSESQVSIRPPFGTSAVSRRQPEPESSTIRRSNNHNRSIPNFDSAKANYQKTWTAPNYHYLSSSPSSSSSTPSAANSNTRRSTGSTSAGKVQGHQGYNSPTSHNQSSVGQVRQPREDSSANMKMMLSSLKRSQGVDRDDRECGTLARYVADLSKAQTSTNGRVQQTPSSHNKLGSRHETHSFSTHSGSSSAGFEQAVKRGDTFRAKYGKLKDAPPRSSRPSGGSQKKNYGGLQAHAVATSTITTHYELDTPTLNSYPRADAAMDVDVVDGSVTVPPPRAMVPTTNNQDVNMVSITSGNIVPSTITGAGSASQPNKDHVTAINKPTKVEVIDLTQHEDDEALTVSTPVNNSGPSHASSINGTFDSNEYSKAQPMEVEHDNLFSQSQMSRTSARNNASVQIRVPVSIGQSIPVRLEGRESMSPTRIQGQTTSNNIQQVNKLTQEDDDDEDPFSPIFSPMVNAGASTSNVEIAAIPTFTSDGDVMNVDCDNVWSDFSVGTRIESSSKPPAATQAQILESENVSMTAAVNNPSVTFRVPLSGDGSMPVNLESRESTSHLRILGRMLNNNIQEVNNLTQEDGDDEDPFSPPMVNAGASTFNAGIAAVLAFTPNENEMNVDVDGDDIDACSELSNDRLIEISSTTTVTTAAQLFASENGLEQSGAAISKRPLATFTITGVKVTSAIAEDVFTGFIPPEIVELTSQYLHPHEVVKLQRLSKVHRPHMSYDFAKRNLAAFVGSHSNSDERQSNYRMLPRIYIKAAISVLGVKAAFESIMRVKDLTGILGLVDGLNDEVPNLMEVSTLIREVVLHENLNFQQSENYIAKLFSALGDVDTLDAFKQHVVFSDGDNEAIIGNAIEFYRLDVLSWILPRTEVRIAKRDYFMKETIRPGGNSTLVDLLFQDLGPTQNVDYNVLVEDILFTHTRSNLTIRRRNPQRNLQTDLEVLRLIIENGSNFHPVTAMSRISMSFMGLTTEEKRQISIPGLEMLFDHPQFQQNPNALPAPNQVTMFLMFLDAVTLDDVSYFRTWIQYDNVDYSPGNTTYNAAIMTAINCNCRNVLEFMANLAKREGNSNFLFHMAMRNSLKFNDAAAVNTLLGCPGFREAMEVQETNGR
ncbi:hypothetical protein HDU76_003461, partial [Blyttiomyces sp. JEL0837]